MLFPCGFITEANITSSCDLSNAGLLDVKALGLMTEINFAARRVAVLKSRIKVMLNLNFYRHAVACLFSVNSDR